MPGALAHEWHKTYSVGPIKVLGNLACIVTSKILGIGSAERHWKTVKYLKTYQRGNTGDIKCKKQALIYSTSIQKNSSCREEKISSSGKLWSVNDFQVLKMGLFFNDIIDSLDAPQSNDGEMRIFCEWVETWEKKKLGNTGDPIFEIILVRKYGFLKWIDPDNSYTLWVAHPNRIYFNKKSRNNKYHICATLEEYDLSIPPEAQLNFYKVWWSETDFFEQIIYYYKDDYITNYHRDSW